MQLQQINSPLNQFDQKPNFMSATQGPEDLKSKLRAAKRSEAMNRERLNHTTLN